MKFLKQWSFLVLGGFLFGCATMDITQLGVFQTQETLAQVFAQHPEWPQASRSTFIQGKIRLGMTKSQVAYLLGKRNFYKEVNEPGHVYQMWFNPGGIGRTEYYREVVMDNGTVVRIQYIGSDGQRKEIEAGGSKDSLLGVPSASALSRSGYR